MSINGTNPTQVNLSGYLNYLSGATTHDSDTDLATAVIAEQLRAKDGTVKRMLRDIRMVASARSMIAKRLVTLRTALDKLKNNPKNKDNKMSFSASELQGDAINQLELRFNHEDGTVRQENGAQLKGKRWDYGKEPNLSVSGDTVQAEIKRLEGVAQQLDSDREVRMIRLNSQMSKRGNMLQMLSNITKKANETKGAIIANMR